MTQQATRTINGRAYDWSSVVIRIDGVEFEGVQSIKYAQKRERKKVRGQGGNRRPIAVTPGQYNAEDATIGVEKRTADQIREHLSKRAGDGKSYGDALFPITVQYIEDGIKPIKDELFSCWIIGDDGGGEESSSDEAKEELQIGVLWIVRNGKTLYRARRGR